jgi:hypothetical protein
MEIMPYYIKHGAKGCAGWATTKADGVVITCHSTKKDAIAHMVALSIAEKTPPGGELGKKKAEAPTIEEWAMLNERQKEQATNNAELAVEFGMFDQSSKANGAHYAPAAKNPFKASGLMCQNCVFFNENGQCQLVAGKIEPEAICKLWVIPETKIKE